MSETAEIVRAASGGVSLAATIERLKPQIAAALPAHIGADRFARMALTALRTNDALARCTTESVMGGLLLGAQLGLELNGPRGQAYLVPFKDKRGISHAQFIIGYKGMVDLAYRSRDLRDIFAGVVREEDGFSYQHGSAPKLTHSPKLGGSGAVIGYYAIARLRGGGQVFQVLSPAEVEAHRKRSRAKDSGPWVTDYEAMAKKTCVRTLFPFLPLSTDEARAVDADERTVVISDSEEGWSVDAGN